MQWPLSLISALAASSAGALAGEVGLPLAVRIRDEVCTDRQLEEGLIEMHNHGVKTFYLGNLTFVNSDVAIELDVAGVWKQMGQAKQREIRAKIPDALIYAEIRVPMYINNYYGSDFGRKMCRGLEAGGFDGVEIDFTDIASMSSSFQFYSDVITACENLGLKAVFNGIERLYNKVDSLDQDSRIPDIVEDLTAAYFPQHFMIQRYQDDRIVSFSNTTYEAIFQDPYDGVATLMSSYPQLDSSVFVLHYPLLPSDTADLENYIDMATLHDYGCRARSQFDWTGGFVMTKHHFDNPNYDLFDTLSSPCP